jgi:acetyl esterase/lipase
MKRLAYLVLFTLVQILFATPSPAQAQKEGVTIKNDIVYAKVNGEDLMLNLALPKTGNGPAPAILCVHGGGWKGGHRNSMNMLIGLLAEKGFVAATVSYRLVPKAKFPAQIEDVKAAVRWLRAHAKEYNINPDKIGAVGLSAGGHLVSLLGAADKSAGLEGNGGNLDQSSRVQAVVNFFGPTDFITKTWTKQIEEAFFIGFLGGTYDEAKETYVKASPLHYVSKDDPPFLFIHGDKDKLVDIHHSKVMHAKLKEVGVPSELLIMEGQAHGWTGEALTKSLNHTIRFFEEKLKK